MIDIIKGLLSVMSEYDLYADDLPLEFDFNKNDYGIFYLLNTGLDEEGYHDYDLQIHITAIKEKKLKQLQTVFDIEKLLNETMLSDKVRVIKKNAFLNHYSEQNKNTYILEFYAREYKL